MVARMDEFSPEGDFSLRLAPFATWMLAGWSIAPQFTTAVKLKGQLECPEAPSFAEKRAKLELWPRRLELCRDELPA
jgi:hypothetical protein